MVDVEQWAELRRRALRARRVDQGARPADGLSRNTVRRGVAREGPPRYRRAPAGSKLDPFKDEIHRLLRERSEAAGVSGSVS